MLDLNKLARNLKEALAKETTESIDAWLKEYEDESICSYVGQGSYGKEVVKKDVYFIMLKCHALPEVYSGDESMVEYINMSQAA
jgi:hypothetical protein